MINTVQSRQCFMPPEIREAWRLTQWCPDVVTLYPSPIVPFVDVGISPEELFDRFSPARANPDVTFHVTPSGNDQQDGRAPATAFRSIAAACEAATKTGARSAKVFVHGRRDRKPAEYAAGHGFGQITCDMAFIATGGTITAGSWLAFEPTKFDRSDLSPATYVCEMRDLDRVTDRTELTDRFACLELRNLDPVIEDGDIAVLASTLVAHTPNSWAIEDGRLFIHRADGQRPTPANTRLYPSGGECLVISERVSVFMGGETGADIWELEGGSRCTVDTPYEQRPTSEHQALVFSGVSAGYAGKWWNGANAFGFDGVHGLVALFNCKAIACSADGFNAHRKRRGLIHFMTVNCSAIGNGRGVSSANGWTLHEDVLGLDFAGIYRFNHGGTLGNTGKSKCWVVGSVVSNDMGDVQWGSIATPQAVKMGRESVAYLDGVTVDMPAATFALRNPDAGRIHTRHMAPQRIPSVGRIESEMPRLRDLTRGQETEDVPSALGGSLAH